jgi:hypothetical protein
MLFKQLEEDFAAEIEVQATSSQVLTSSQVNMITMKKSLK